MNVEKILAHAVNFHCLDAKIFADAVLDVHDVIAWVNVAEVADFLADILCGNFCAAMMNLSAENVLLGYDSQFGVRQGKAFAQVAQLQNYSGQVIFVQQLHHAV